MLLEHLNKPGLHDYTAISWCHGNCWFLDIVFDAGIAFFFCFRILFCVISKLKPKIKIYNESRPDRSCSDIVKSAQF